MAFTGNYVCNSFRQEMLKGLHDFTTGTGDTFKIALYTASATLNANTTNYTTTGEVASGGGYTTGGNALTISASMPGLSGSTTLIDFADVTWATSTITARGALIYNSTPASGSNLAVVVLDFLADKTSTGSDFTVVFPPASATRAIIRVS